MQEPLVATYPVGGVGDTGAGGVDVGIQQYESTVCRLHSFPLPQGAGSPTWGGQLPYITSLPAQGPDVAIYDAKTGREFGRKNKTKKPIKRRIGKMNFRRKNILMNRPVA